MGSRDARMPVAGITAAGTGLLTAAIGEIVFQVKRKKAKTKSKAKAQPRPALR